MKVTLWCFGIGILILCGVVIYQDRQLDAMKKEQLDQAKFQNELATLNLLQYQAQRKTNIETAWELRCIKEGNARSEELTAYNVGKGKLLPLPSILDRKFDAPEIIAPLYELPAPKKVRNGFDD